LFANRYSVYKRRLKQFSTTNYSKAQSLNLIGVSFKLIMGGAGKGEDAVNTNPEANPTKQ